MKLNNLHYRDKLQSWLPSNIRPNISRIFDQKRVLAHHAWTNISPLFMPGPQSNSQSNAKHVKFRELAEARTNRALQAIGRIGNLANRQLYVYEEAEVRKIVRALKDAVAEIEARFGSSGKKADPGFKL